MVPTIPALFPAAEAQRRCRGPRLRSARVTATAPARPPPLRGCPGCSPRTASAPHIHLPKSLSPQSLEGRQGAAGQAVEAGDAGAKRTRVCPAAQLSFFRRRTGAAPRCRAGHGAVGQPGHRKARPGPTAQPDPAGGGSKAPRFSRGDHGQPPHRANPAPGEPRTGHTPLLPRVPARGAPLCPAAALTKPCLSEMLLVSLSL